MNSYKSWKGSTTGNHDLKLSDSTEFKLKTWNSTASNKQWVRTSLGASRKTLDTGLDFDDKCETKIYTPSQKDVSVNSEEFQIVKETVDLMDYNSRLKSLQLKTLQERKKIQNKRLLSNDRTMLLHNERQRYDELEGEYQKLLHQVQKLQQSHSNELNTILKKNKSSVRALGHALDIKSQEIVELNRSLKEWQTRYADESTKWIFVNEELKEKLKPLQNRLTEFKEIVDKKDLMIQKLEEKLSESYHNFKLKDDELNRFINSFRRTESSFNKEREAWLNLKVELSETIKQVEDLKKENDRLKLGQSKSNQVISDMNSMKPILDEAKSKIQNLLEREKGYLGEIETLKSDKNDLLQHRQDLKEDIQKLEREILILRGNYGISLKEIESLKVSNAEILELNVKLTKDTQEEKSEINHFKNQIDLLNSKNIKLEQKAIGLSQLNEEYQRQILKLQKEVDFSKSSSSDYYNRIETLMHEKSQISSTLSLVQQDLYDLTNRFQEQSYMYEEEKRSKEEIIKENSIKFENVSSRINKLQSTIEETSKLLQEYKNNEIILRGNLSERNDLLKEKELEVLQLRNTCISLQESLSNQSKEFQNLTESRKLQVLKLSEMYESDLESFKTKLSKLESKLVYTSNSLNESRIENTNLKYENASLVSQVCNLKSEIQNFRDSESNMHSKISSLESMILTFESQISMYKSKITSLESQISVLEKESKISNSSFSFEPLKLGKLQEKLSHQLESLVENQF